eukprot:10564321-Karenia_brevis.AAC.1
MAFVKAGHESQVLFAADLLDDSSHSSSVVFDAIAEVLNCKGMLMISFNAAISELERRWQWKPPL